jgi:GNAT superfamily N-acetyltransferase
LSDLEVREVRNAADVDAFAEAARRGQAGNARWVEPVSDEMRWVFDRKTSPLMLENDIRAFVAFREGAPIGRIAAIVNRAHLDKYHDGGGQFGLIEAIDDRAVFAALVDAAAAYLRERGLRRMRGPFSLSINHETGLLVHGFDEPHVVRTNHAPPFYAAHLEALGLRKAMDLFAYVCTISQSEFPERVEKLSRRFNRSSEIKTRGLSLIRWSTQFPRVLDLYNDAWRDNWSSIPVSPLEAKMIAHLMLPVSKPSWIRMAQWRGEDIAVVSQIPDVNEALQGLHGQLLPFGWVRLMGRLHGRGTRMTRLPMIGVASRWRGTQIGSMAVSLLLAEAVAQARRAKVEEMEISWMLETNHAVLNLVASLPARHTRTFRVYEMNL